MSASRSAALASAEKEDLPRPQPPIEIDARIESPAKSAGGIPAIAEVAKFMVREEGTLRGPAALAMLNQEQGFDCPGCAWPDPEGHRSFTEFCENGAKAVAEETTNRLAGPDFFAIWSLPALSEQSDYWLGRQGRLAQPMFLSRGEDHYNPISWDDAFKLIAAELNALAGPDEAIFYTSGRTSNEAAFLYQLFVRQFGTNNLPDCSNMCHESSGAALNEVIGVGKGTLTRKDFELADCIFIIGQNPGTCHPRMLAPLETAARRGCKIVSVNPLAEAGMVGFRHPQHALEWIGKARPIASMFLQLRINGDAALFKGMMKEMLAEEELRPGSALDRKFIAEKTSGFAELGAALNQITWNDIESRSGLARSEIRAAAELAMRSKNIICCWAMGLTQHKNAIATIQEIVNFMLLRGNVGRPGAGLCPVRGHSNVQGDRTMGIWEKPAKPFLDRLGKRFNFEPPRHHGYDTVNSIHAMHDGVAKVFFALGGNFLSASPDTEYTARALRRCRLTVHVSTKLNRAHLITGEQALILPCLGRTERDLQPSGAQFISVENSMGIVHASRKSVQCGSRHLLSEPAIVARLAHSTLGSRSAVDWLSLAANYDRIRDEIEQVIPGFENYNRRVRQESGFYLPNAARDGVFNTADRKAHFTVHALSGQQFRDHEFLLTTIRSHDQFNTTIYGLNDRYRGIAGGRRVVFLNEQDMKENGWSKGQLLNLTSHYDGGTRIAEKFAAVPYNIPRRCAAAYFPETNVLVPIGSTADVSNTPASKSVPISIAPSA